MMARLGVGFFYPVGVTLGFLALAACVFVPRPFCGWICPVGTVQDLLGDVGARLRIATRTTPHWLNERLRFFAFGVAVFVVLVTAAKGVLACALGCPAFWACAVWRVPIPAATAAILIATAALSLRVKRAFCRYICPLGALMGLVSALSRRAVVRNIEVCDGCGACRYVCPMGIDPMRGLVVKSAHCISCGECVAACPKGALAWGRRRSPFGG